MMARTSKSDPPPVKNGWFQPQVTWGNLINLCGLIAVGGVFYATTNATLNEHSRSIGDLRTSQVKIEELLRSKSSSENGEREKLRDDFMRQMQQTASGIADLNTKTAVTSTQLLAIKDELIKIGNKLDSVPVVAPIPQRGGR